MSTAVVLVGLWYFSFVRYNHRRGIRALHWVESACARHGRIIEARWTGSSRLHAQLHFAANWVENARVTIRLLPRPLPLQWFLSRWNKQKETITFEADLDCAPVIHLEVMRHRWLTQPSSKVSKKSKQWTISRPGPVVLTTSTEWREELPPIVNTLMTTRGHSLVSVRLRPDSPHLAATIDLEDLSNEAAAASFLGVLRDLAGASTSRQ
ncbi:MAG TPA: hypothetical protein VF753_08800 [Terriglobales bacterium]